MKKYLLIDVYSNIAKKCTYEELKERLIIELKHDIIDNLEEHNIKDIVEYNFEIIRKLSIDKKENIKLIKENLEGFGWDIKKAEELL